MSVRVVLADDHPVVREGIAALLAAEPDMEIVGEAADGDEVLAVAARVRPHVVLMDLRMPRLDGATATARIVADQPGTHVLVLTTYDTDADVLRAVEAGATGYLLKDASRAELVDAVRAAARGDTVLAPPVVQRLVGRARQPAQAEPSEREREVLELVARGLTNAAIGRRLHIEESTVKTHLVRLFAKLDVEDRTRAVTAALELGILRSPGDNP